MRGREIMSMLKSVADKWQRDDCSTMGASLAYFALFSFFPLILVILSVVGFVVDPTEFEVRQRLIDLIGSEQVRELITDTLGNLSENRVNTGLIGFATLLLAASGIFGALDRAFDVIWDVRISEQPKQTGFVAAAWGFIQQKLLAFALVLGCAILILLSILSTVVVTAVSTYTTWVPGQGLLLQTGQFLLALVLLALALTAIYKSLPDRAVAWGDVWPAALVAALLFAALQKLIGIYLSLNNYGSYGAVGGVMALMVYIYLTSLVLLLGGELSYAYARTFGSLAARDKAAQRPGGSPSSEQRAPSTKN